jgi:hypothetical protein
MNLLGVDLWLREVVDSDSVPLLISEKNRRIQAASVIGGGPSPSVRY